LTPRSTLDADGARSLRLRQATFVILSVGILWRLIRYALRFPLWGDEASVALNLLDRDFGTILQPLKYGQVAPVLFLWGELAMQKFLGASEYALRLFPLMSGMLATFFFWRWSKLLRDDTYALFAVGFYALGYYTVRHSVEIKPYAEDQLVATVLLLVATLWMLRPERLRYGWLLAAMLPIGVAGSFPSVFLAGGIMLALAAAFLRHHKISIWIVWLLCGIALIATFALLYTRVDATRYNQIQRIMHWGWRDSFPPPRFFPFVVWLLDAHTGNIFAYPVGGNHGGSTITFLLFLVGVWWVIRNRGWEWRLLIFVPFALTFVAAAIHRYPYGGSARVAQHLAPAICLLAAVGLTFVIRKLIPEERFRHRAVVGIFALFVVIAVIGIARDFARPYHGAADQLVRSTIRQTLASSSAPILVLQLMQKVPSNQQYYLRLAGGRVRWTKLEDVPSELPVNGTQVLMNFDPSADPTTASDRWRDVLTSWEVKEQRKVVARTTPFEPPFWQIITLQPKHAE
jgi:hypothetical protein